MRLAHFPALLLFALVMFNDVKGLLGLFR